MVSDTALARCSLDEGLEAKLESFFCHEPRSSFELSDGFGADPDEVDGDGSESDEAGDC
jgi:hypothetical protein